MKAYYLNGFRFFIDDGIATIEVGKNTDRVLCEIAEARNVYRAVSKNELHTISEVRAFLNHEDLFKEYDKSRNMDTVCVIAIRKDYTAYIKKYTWNEWECDYILGNQRAFPMRCTDGKIREYEYE